MPDTPRAFVQPSQCVPFRGGVVCLSGPYLTIDVDGREVLFEMHSYFGPMPLNKRTEEPLERIPRGFWEAFDRWVSGGKLVDGNQCIAQESKS
jgi:hypothetical protein